MTEPNNMMPGAIEFVKSGLIWSREKPSRPGWYFWRKEGLGDEPTMALVDWTPHREQRYVLFHNRADSDIVAFMDSGEWAGPIEPPRT